VSHDAVLVHIDGLIQEEEKEEDDATLCDSDKNLSKKLQVQIKKRL